MSACFYREMAGFLCILGVIMKAIKHNPEATMFKLISQKKFIKKLPYYKTLDLDYHTTVNQYERLQDDGSIVIEKRISGQYATHNGIPVRGWRCD